MNTKQLILFWYVGFALIIAISSAMPYTDFRDLIISVAIIFLLAILLYLTFRDSEKIRRKTVIYSAIIPLGLIVLIIITSALIINTNVFATQIPKEKIELFDLDLDLGKKPYYGKRVTLNGRLKNNSEYPLNNIEFRIRIHELEKPDSLGEDTIPSDLFFNTNKQLDELPKEIKEKVGRVIDTEILTWNEYKGLEPGETKSFSAAENRSTLQPSQFWVWSYEIISASSQ